MKYCILIVHPNKAFDAERQKEDAIVFVNYWSTDSSEWSLLECESKKQRNLLLKIMHSKTEKIQQYALGYKHGKNNEEYNPGYENF